MSLNCREIDLVLSELNLAGSHIQKILQSSYDVLALKLYKAGVTKTLLIALTPGACRLHETFKAVPKSDKPLRFSQFLKSHIINSRIEEAVQLGDDRIVRILVRRGEQHFRLYLRLWSNAANLVVTDENGIVLDAMRRSPKRGEISGGTYKPEELLQVNVKQGEESRIYKVRTLEGDGSFNQRLDTWYSQQGGALSLQALREQAQKLYEGRIGRLTAALDNLRLKKEDYVHSGKWREYGDIIMGNMDSIDTNSRWLETENFYTRETVRIKLNPEKTPAANAEGYYQQYKRAHSGLQELEREIETGDAELANLKKSLSDLLREENPLHLHKTLREERRIHKPEAKSRPGLSFRRQGWLLMVGRDASENDELLRHHVRGQDLWLHTRDYPGAYVFIKGQSKKSVPLEILLDAANLALFYSKARNAREGALFYTQVKYLRRVKKGPKGLVIPTQEKNLQIKLDDERLRALELAREE